MSSSTKTVTDSTFISDVLEADDVVIVDFWAEWCEPCRMVSPALEQIAGEQSGALTVAKLNVDENPVTASDCKVMAIPTLAAFKGGELVKRLVGAYPKSGILHEPDEFLG